VRRAAARVHATHAELASPRGLPAAPRSGRSPGYGHTRPDADASRPQAGSSWDDAQSGTAKCRKAIVWHTHVRPSATHPGPRADRVTHVT
jgi:hypothetical protein